MEELFLDDNKRYRIFLDEPSSCMFHVYLNDDIGEANEYTDLIHLIRKLQPQDTLHLYINTHGGSLYTCSEIVNVILESEATIIGVASGAVMSAGAIIFLACPFKRVSNYVQFLAHDYSGGEMGESSKMLDSLVATREYYRTLVQGTCKGFLTEVEVDSFLSGKDLWLSSEEVFEKLSAGEKEAIAGELGDDNCSKILMQLAQWPEDQDVSDEDFKVIMGILDRPVVEGGVD